MSVAVGYVPTPEGVAALHAAVREAALRRTSLEILGPVGNGDVGTSQPAIVEALALASAAGVPARLRPSEDGDPAEVIIDASYEDAVELVVIGVRRRSPVGKLFLGSTAQRVILEAGCPVTAVKVDVGSRT